MYWQKCESVQVGTIPVVGRAQVSTEDLLVTRVKRTESRGTRGEWIVPCGDRRVLDVSDFFLLSGSMSERGISACGRSSFHVASGQFHDLLTLDGH